MTWGPLVSCNNCRGHLWSFVFCNSAMSAVYKVKILQQITHHTPQKTDLRIRILCKSVFQWPLLPFKLFFFLTFFLSFLLKSCGDCVGNYKIRSVTQHWAQKEHVEIYQEFQHLLGNNLKCFSRIHSYYVSA